MQPKIFCDDSKFNKVQSPENQMKEFSEAYFNNLIHLELLTCAI